MNTRRRRSCGSSGTNLLCFPLRKQILHTRGNGESQKSFLHVTVCYLAWGMGHHSRKGTGEDAPDRQSVFAQQVPMFFLLPNRKSLGKRKQPYLHRSAKFVFASVETDSTAKKRKGKNSFGLSPLPLTLMSVGCITFRHLLSSCLSAKKLHYG